MTIPFFAHVAGVSNIIPAYAGIRAWKRLDYSLKIFSVFCIFTMLTDFLEFILGRLGIYNQFISNYHLVIEFACIMFIFYVWTKSRALKEAIQYITMGYVVIWLIYKLYFEDPAKFSDVILPLSNFFCIIISGIVFFKLARRKPSITTIPMFWFSTGILLNASGTILIHLFSNAILQMGVQYFNAFWHIHWGFTIITNLCYAKGFSVAKAEGFQ